MEKICLLPDSPQIGSSVKEALKDEVLPVRCPVAIVAIHGAGPVLQKAMHAAAVGRDFPGLAATQTTRGCGADRKPQYMAVRGPAQPVGKRWRACELVRGIGLEIDDLEITSVRNQKVAIGHPRSVRRNQIAQPGWRASQNRQRP